MNLDTVVLSSRPKMQQSGPDEEKCCAVDTKSIRGRVSSGGYLRAGVGTLSSVACVRKPFSGTEKPVAAFFYARLESVCTLIAYRGFESHPVRVSGCVCRLCAQCLIIIEGRDSAWCRFEIYTQTHPSFDSRRPRNAKHCEGMT